jgi:predicted small metal-binding protein
MENKELAECYQPLFDLMSKEHGLILTTSEMDEIIKAAIKVKSFS